MKLKIRAYTPWEEYNHLKYLYSKKSFFKKQGYKISIPIDEYFQDLWNSDNEVTDFKFDKNEFGNKFYNKERYQKKIIETQNSFKDIERSFKRLEKLGIKNFKKFNEYEIKFAVYGTGGSYCFKNGNIIILISSYIESLHTVIHEMIHIGVEESWVKTLGLKHWEKEALVDGICKKYFSDILVDYEVQKNVDRDIFNLVMEENLDNLFSKIENYKKTKK